MKHVLGWFLTGFHRWGAAKPSFTSWNLFRVPYPYAPWDYLSVVERNQLGPYSSPNGVSDCES